MKDRGIEKVWAERQAEEAGIYHEGVPGDVDKIGRTAVVAITGNFAVLHGERSDSLLERGRFEYKRIKETFMTVKEKFDLDRDIYITEVGWSFTGPQNQPNCRIAYQSPFSSVKGIHTARILVPSPSGASEVEMVFSGKKTLDTRNPQSRRLIFDVDTTMRLIRGGQSYDVPLKSPEQPDSFGYDFVESWLESAVNVEDEIQVSYTKPRTRA